MNELAVQPEQPVGDESGAKAPSALKKIKRVQNAFGSEIAQHGHEVFVRTAEQWVPATGLMKRHLLETFGSEPVGTGLWAAFLTYFSVDPNDDGTHNYYQRLRGEDGCYSHWKPMPSEPHKVYFNAGAYNLVSRSYTPYGENVMPFGALIQHRPTEEMMEAVRTDNYEKCSKKAKEVFDMVSYALGTDAGADRDTENYFRGVVAQILRPHSGWTQFVTIRGESGARKTTVMRALLSAPMGSRGLSEISEALLSDRIFMRPGLVNRIANLSNDSEQSDKFPCFIKEVTSGVLVVEKKFRDATKVKLSAKLFSTMNQPQNLTDESLGVENRLITFEFRPRPPAENNRGATGTQWMDPEFYSDEDRQWIVAWMLVALEKQWEKGHEELPLPTERALQWKEDMLNQATPLRGFVKSALEFGPATDEQYQVAKTDVYDSAVDHGVLQPGSHAGHTKLGKYLSIRHNVREGVKRHDGKLIRVFRGCRLKT